MIYQHPIFSTDEELEYYLDRTSKIYECDKLEKERMETFKREKFGDLKYKHPNDVPLTDEQMAQLKEYWKKYEFCIPLNPDACKTYYNRTGIFDVHYTMHSMRHFIRDTTCPDNYRYAFQNKGYLEKLFTHARMPVTLLRRVNGINLDSSWNAISTKEVLDIVMPYFESGKELVLKASASSGGGIRVRFLKDLSYDEMNSLLTKGTMDLVIQEPIVQHPFMNALNSSTVNTIRLTTYIKDGSAIPLAALIKVGNANVRVDNFMHGGHILGMNLDGTSYNWALNIAHERVSVLPSGVDLSNGITIPFFKEAVQMACESHLEIAPIRLVSWDICITAEGPMIIECNFGGDIRMHQAVTGPIFGQFSDEFFNEILVKKFFKPRADWNYDFNEYRDYVIITKYAGMDTKVVVPDTLNGKPVRRIAKEAFAKTAVTSVEIPEGIRFIGTGAFKDCSKLTEVKLPKSLNRISSQAFKNCVSLTHVDISEKVKVDDDTFEGCTKLI